MEGYKQKHLKDHISLSVLFEINLRYQLSRPPKSLSYSQTCVVASGRVGLENGFSLVDSQCSGTSFLNNFLVVSNDHALVFHWVIMRKLSKCLQFDVFSSEVRGSTLHV